MLLAVVCTAVRCSLSASCQQVFTSLSSSSPRRNLPHIPVSGFWWDTQPCGHEDTGAGLPAASQRTADVPVAPGLAFPGDTGLSPEPLSDLSRAQWKQEENASSSVLSFVSGSTFACSAAVLLSAEGKSSAVNKQHWGLSAPSACSCPNSKPSFHEGFVSHTAPTHISYL